MVLRTSLPDTCRVYVQHEPRPCRPPRGVQGLAGGAQRVAQDVAGDHRDFRLSKNNLIVGAVLNGLHGGVQRDLVIVAVGSVIAVAAVAARGSGSRAVHDDGDHAVALPLETVMEVEPVPTAVITPLGLTVATLLLPDL